MMMMMTKMMPRPPRDETLPDRVGHQQRRATELHNNPMTPLADLPAIYTTGMEHPFVIWCI
jgi:hypothetical protein